MKLFSFFSYPLPPYKDDLSSREVVFREMTSITLSAHISSASAKSSTVISVPLSVPFGFGTWMKPQGISSPRVRT